MVRYGSSVSRPTELPRQSLAEPYVSLSTHKAPIRQEHLSYQFPSVQKALVFLSQSFPKIVSLSFFVYTVGGMLSNNPLISNSKTQSDCQHLLRVISTALLLTCLDDIRMSQLKTVVRLLVQKRVLLPFVLFDQRQ